MSRILPTATRYSVLPESGETAAVPETRGALRQEQGEGRKSLVERVRKGVEVRLQGDTCRRNFRNVETGRLDATGQVVETFDPIFGKVELVVGVQVVDLDETDIVHFIGFPFCEFERGIVDASHIPTKPTFPEPDQAY